MCSPISVVSGGRIAGCFGITEALPYIFGIIGLGGVFAWNVVDSSKKSKEETKKH